MLSLSRGQVKLQSGEVTTDDIESVCMGNVLSPPSGAAAEEDDVAGLESPSTRNDYCTSLVVPKTLFV